jgi:hypothetical protein
MDFEHYGRSYRRSIDGAQYTSGNGIATQNTIYYSNRRCEFNNFMFAYTYSHVAGAVKFDDGVITNHFRY